MTARKYRPVFLLALLSLLPLLALPVHATPKRSSGESTTPQSVDEILKALGPDSSDIAQRRALQQLVALSSDAREEIRSATQSASSPSLRNLLELANLKILAKDLVAVIGKHQESQLVFDGQYNDLKDGKSPEEIAETVAGLLYILDDEDVAEIENSAILIRMGSINALADIADKKILSPIRRLERDPLIHPELSSQLGILMAIFGDTRRVDRRLAKLVERAEVPEPLRALEANVELANIYYKIRNYKEAVERYKLILGTYKKIRRGLQRQRSAPAVDLLAGQFSDQQMALQYYNAACSNSLAGNIVEARLLLEQAVRLDPIHFSNIRIDGDLKNLRDAEDHSEYLKELQSAVDEESI